MICALDSTLSSLLYACKLCLFDTCIIFIVTNDFEALVYNIGVTASGCLTSTALQKKGLFLLHVNEVYVAYLKHREM